MADLPKRLSKSLARIQKCGGVILIHHASSSAIDYSLSNGKSVSPGVVSKLKDAGLLVSGKDGLFGGDEQTLHVVAA